VYNGCILISIEAVVLTARWVGECMYISPRARVTWWYIQRPHFILSSALLMHSGLWCFTKSLDMDRQRL
jgi:hypothetical protein